MSLTGRASPRLRGGYFLIHQRRDDDLDGMPVPESRMLDLAKCVPGIARRPIVAARNRRGRSTRLTARKKESQELLRYRETLKEARDQGSGDNQPLAQGSGGARARCARRCRTATRDVAGQTQARDRGRDTAGDTMRSRGEKVADPDGRWRTKKLTAQDVTEAAAPLVEATLARSTSAR